MAAQIKHRRSSLAQLLVALPFAVLALQVTGNLPVAFNNLWRPARQEPLRPSGTSSRGTEEQTQLPPPASEDATPSLLASLARAGAAVALALCVATANVVGTAPSARWFSPEPAWAGTYSSGSRVNRDPVSLLQTAIPLEETLGEEKCKTVRTLQAAIEEVRGDTTTRFWELATGKTKEIIDILKNKEKALLAPVDASRKDEAAGLLKKLSIEVQALSGLTIEGQDAGVGEIRDAQAAGAVFGSLDRCQSLLGQFEELMLPPGYVTPVPAKLADKYPQLQGRATVEFVLKRAPGTKPKTYTAANGDVVPTATIRILCDGWAMPLSAGNFIDLVDKGIYKDMPIQRADGFVVQTGDLPGGGYREGPKNKLREIPLELSIKGIKETRYGDTIDEAGLLKYPVKIPFQAEGTISLARQEIDNDSASAAFFIFLFESDMNPAGKNLLDGRYASFGYTLQGTEYLRQIQEGDILVEAKVVDGLDKLIRPYVEPPPPPPAAADV
mmetsp:Transcript_59768/g.142224  ORF Transcript_59768/g.142224 Transcript_59768/m.142224 type:complete len:498 (-) Transcript_59768:92-1585(-)